MIEELYINGTDARTWGVVLDEKSLSVLMTPVPTKGDIVNSSRLQHGIRVIETEPMKAERDINISIGIVASSRSEFYERYNAFCNDVLLRGNVHIETIYQPGVVYKCRYRRCEPITYFNGSIGRFSLSLQEPNPDNRSKEQYTDQ